MAHEIQKQNELKQNDEAQKRLAATVDLLKANENNNNNNSSDDDDEYIQYLGDEYGFHTNLDGTKINSKSVKEKKGGEKKKDDSEKIKHNNNDKTQYRKLANEMYKDLMTSLNERQNRILLNVLNNIKTKKLFYYFISGGSGTGKSHLIKAIYYTVCRYLDCFDPESDDFDESNVNDIDSKKENLNIIKCAYTGRAAFLIRGQTIHGAFALPLFGNGSMAPLSLENKNHFRKLYANLRLIIFDEISLVDPMRFKQVDTRLRQIFDRPNDAFGGISVITVGDFNQLKPVCKYWIFNKNPKNPYEQLQNYQTNELWDKFRLIELKEIMRQKNDLEFAKALTVIGNEDLVGLSKQQIKLFDSRIISSNKKITQKDNEIYIEDIY